MSLGTFVYLLVEAWIFLSGGGALMYMAVKLLAEQGSSGSVFLKSLALAAILGPVGLCLSLVSISRCVMLVKQIMVGGVPSIF